MTRENTNPNDTDDEYTLSDDEIKNPVEISCPECGTTGNVPEWWIGFTTECKDCENQFIVRGE